MEARGTARELASVMDDASAAPLVSQEQGVWMELLFLGGSIKRAWSSFISRRPERLGEFFFILDYDRERTMISNPRHTDLSNDRNICSIRFKSCDRPARHVV